MTAVLVTRPAGRADPLVRRLTDLGYRVHAVPTVATVPARMNAADLEGYDWIVVTSAAAVRLLPDIPPASRWAAVGPVTAAALAQRGIKAEVAPSPASGAAVAAALPDPAGSRILLARADAAATDLPELLRERGAEVSELVAYHTVVGPQGSHDNLARALADPDLAAVVFASGSAVEGFRRLGGTARWPAVTIGPRTTAAASAAGFEVAAEADEQAWEALVAAVVRAIPVRDAQP
jgi:uroporphyrinogen-III synthase